MMQEKTMLQGNEDVRSEMEKILWTPVLSENEEITEENNNEEVKVVMKDVKTPENEVEVETPNNEVEKPKVEKPKRAKKTPSATTVPANDEWVNSIPDEEKLSEGDVLYCIGGDGKGKFAQVIGYGKKQNIVWANMFKKASTDFMSRPWSLTITDTVVVKKDGQLMDGFDENNGVYSLNANFVNETK